MSLLNHLWDDTVAGPMPDSGLGKLRKQSTFGSRLNSGKESEGGGAMSSYGGDVPEEARKVTRSIMIVKPPGYSSSPPASPAGSTPPVSPFSGGRESFRFRRRSTSDTYEKASETGPRGPSSPYGL